jgi:hypothetical protein
MPEIKDLKKHIIGILVTLVELKKEKQIKFLMVDSLTELLKKLLKE